MSRGGLRRLGSLLGLMVLAAWIAGCGDPAFWVAVTVRVPPAVQAEYSAGSRGLVAAHLDAGSADHNAILGILCDPSQETVEVVYGIGGDGCKGEGTVTVWAEPADPDFDPPRCDMDHGFSEYPGDPSYEVPEDAPQASARVFEGVSDWPCRGGDDEVTLTLEYP